MHFHYIELANVSEMRVYGSYSEYPKYILKPNKFYFLLLYMK